jgi:Tfp pilus assembly protein PilF
MKYLSMCFLIALPALAQTQADVTQCATLRKHGDAGATACFQRLARSNDPAIKAEGLWGLRDFQGANNAFRDAVKLHDKDANLRVRWGRMFFEHNVGSDSATAVDLMKEALEIDKDNAQALLGAALVSSENYDPEAAGLAEKALKADPKLYEAHELIARMSLEDNNPEKAVQEAQKALAISPEALDALSILASVDWLDDKPGTQWTDKIFKINPTYAQVYATAGHFFVINRRYDEGIQYYRKAIALKPDLWTAHSELGVNLMRFGKNGEARTELELAWNNGYQSNETKNSLMLLDSFKNFETVETPTTALKLYKKESALLKPYFQAEMDLAMATYEKKYKHKLTGQVQVEVYPFHEDFAVRTMGLPGLGALGVTFGQYVAMDADDSDQRPPGSFHWASTMWHELSHVYVLSMTGHRVPRWFTEGLAVYEETAIHKDWGDRLDHGDIEAMKEKKLLPIAELDRGYIHPSYPGQVVISYFQGGQVITYIVEKWGYDKVLDMIHAFADRKTTVEVIQEQLKISPEDFDKQFFPWLEAKYKKELEGFDGWKKGVNAMNEASKKEEWDDVIKQGLVIRDVFPDYVEPGNVYEFLAKAYLAKNDKPKAIAELERYANIGGRSPATLKQLAALESEAGHKREAAAALEKLLLIYLHDEKSHQQLADLDMELGNSTGAIREYQAVLDSGTIDKAGGHLQLAKAFQAAKRIDDARDEVFSALEAAPDFKPAQKLLLELTPQK